MFRFVRFLAIFFVLNFLITLHGTSWASPEEIGRAVSITGSVKVKTALDSRILYKGGPVFRGESIHSDPDSRARIVFIDDSELSIGPSSTISLDDYVFTERDQGLLFKMGKGVFRIITGKIAEQNPDKFNLETPMATLGIRGTILRVRVHNLHETIFTEKISKDRSIFVMNRNFPGMFSTMTEPGTSVDVFPDQPPTAPRPTTPEDLDGVDFDEEEAEEEASEEVEEEVEEEASEEVEEEVAEEVEEEVAEEAAEESTEETEEVTEETEEVTKETEEVTKVAVEEVTGAFDESHEVIEALAPETTETPAPLIMLPALDAPPPPARYETPASPTKP